MSSDMYNPKAVDQLTKQRGICMSKDCDVRKVYILLRDCQHRVKSKPYTAETCHQETVDLLEALDRCVADKAFVKFA
ncbi:uncharacterized protein LOC115444262 [Manduca sexta]|uniref:Ubiquinol-cytochrome C reductase hinge domain-containing protein n=1 Tax=Manduca sexta TaxID=7130 RepID=A0A922CLC7_MANSE|nr:uncharacterized protein LOC115444262 [Manduca sexta]KAG6451235.1 hypothetical protein O3G_MSEX007000 [Manduca sexta]